MSDMKEQLFIRCYMAESALHDYEKSGDALLVTSSYLRGQWMALYGLIRDLRLTQQYARYCYVMECGVADTDD